MFGLPAKENRFCYFAFPKEFLNLLSGFFQDLLTGFSKRHLSFTSFDTDKK